MAQKYDMISPWNVIFASITHRISLDLGHASSGLQCLATVSSQHFLGDMYLEEFVFAT